MYYNFLFSVSQYVFEYREHLTDLYFQIDIIDDRIWFGAEDIIIVSGDSELLEEFANRK